MRFISFQILPPSSSFSFSFGPSFPRLFTLTNLPDFTFASSSTRAGLQAFDVNAVCVADIDLLVEAGSGK
jgi:hypothetical protein